MVAPIKECIGEESIYTYIRKEGDIYAAYRGNY